jgi:hypothetical protein
MSEFGSAFKAARAAGKKTFDFKGKSYTTELKEEKAGRVAKTATRKFAANAVPGRRQTKPKMGGGAAPTPARSPSKERRGAGAIGRGGKDPVAPKDMRGVNQTPITLGKLAKAGAKGALTGAAMASGAGAGRAVMGVADKAQKVTAARGAANAARGAANAASRTKAMGTLYKKLAPKAIKTAEKEMRTPPKSGRAQFRTLRPKARPPKPEAK